MKLSEEEIREVVHCVTREILGPVYSEGMLCKVTEAENRAVEKVKKLVAIREWNGGAS